MQTTSKCFRNEVSDSSVSSSSSDDSYDLEEWIFISKNIISGSDTDSENESSMKTPCEYAYEDSKVSSLSESDVQNQLVADNNYHQNPFTCDNCEKFYFTQQLIENHMKHHHTVNHQILKRHRWKCTVRNCLHSFETKTELTTHQMVHSSEWIDDEMAKSMRNNYCFSRSLAVCVLVWSEVAVEERARNASSSRSRWNLQVQLLTFLSLKRNWSSR